MVAFLSDEWVAALDRAAAGDESLATTCAELHLVVEHEVTGSPFGDVRYHVVIDGGDVRVRPGGAEPSIADAGSVIRFSQDYATATAVALGSGSAQRAFMAGRLRVGGDLRALLDHVAAFEQLHDVFGSVRGEVDVVDA